MKIKTYTALIICFIILSCKKEEKITNQITDKTEKNKSNDQGEKANLTVIYKTRNKNNSEEIRITVSKQSEYDKYLLAEDKNLILVSKYLKNENTFRLVKEDTLISNEYNYTSIGKESFEKVTIKDQEYILLSVHEVYQGSAVTDETVSFIILDTNTLKTYTLIYGGETTVHNGEAIVGKFTENKILDSNPEIKKALYDFANKSKWVFHASKDPNHYTNYMKKWETDNNTVNHLANGYSGIPDIIYSTYYKDDLFSFTGDYDESQSIENDNFKIVSYFRGNILAFDKNKQLYFPIYTEACVTGCDKKIRFVSENSIEVTYHESSQNETSIIHLNEIIFKN
ncbi:hypothetical protein [Flavobacterium sp. HBTb2-11-1]|uniref:hypothetical protein n=1 Tax=Flavobacterium sp. HBTb2-11-1 TaxID=2692212 RepID=UPI00137049F6|nr:hypothetical protein [Flavobacterium sp. HBTb2-11-1]MXO05777.1 hypothetical protein [Flavobacterium sp. HBTb2-11-1]